MRSMWNRLFTGRCAGPDKISVVVSVHKTEFPMCQLMQREMDSAPTVTPPLGGKASVRR
jgi:hypothetical protein